MSENSPRHAAEPSSGDQTASAHTTHPAHAEQERRRPVWQRAIVLVFVVFFAWHGFATVAWLSGSSTLMRVGPVERYMDPLFRQNWSVFAPNPEDFNTHVFVRAEMADGDVTDWYSVTHQDLEDSVQGVPILSRMYQSNFMLALHTLNDINQVSDDERRIVLSEDELQSAETLEAALTSAGFDPGEGFLERTLNESASLTMIASEVAKARWAGGEADEIERVQFRIDVVETPRAPWLGTGPEQYLFDYAPGWREPIWHEGIDPADFEERYGPDRTNGGGAAAGEGARS